MLDCKPFLPDLSSLSRRDILKGGAALLIAGMMPVLTVRRANAAGYAMTGSVTFHNPHTGEHFAGIYRQGDTYLPDAFERINHVLRDFRTGEAFPMDPHVLDIVSIIQTRMGTGKPIEVISGYRSPKTNAMLREASTRVAKNSMHMYGKAMDIRQDGYSSARMRDIARSLQGGGVGYYRRSDFVHVDTGQIRHW